ncbi:Internalin A [Operophtera brumata]|uniref:Internalin A n=1 Tax=Operophtera brumata TaxID=104452 RepID=A0A0L7LU96_OPEBR|nr:Internalin A [Operophtera brumata]
MTLQPPSLLELAGRTIKLHELPVTEGEVPLSLINYLSVAQCCFVDFCGKYRIPLLQYLCSSKCITGSWESREENNNPHPHMMRKVLLG